MSAHDDPSWMALATSPPVVGRALLCALVVGPILISINHGDALVRGAVDGARVAKMALTALVPYCVSTVSSVSMLRSLRTRGPAR